MGYLNGWPYDHDSLRGLVVQFTGLDGRPISVVHRSYQEMMN